MTETRRLKYRDEAVIVGVMLVLLGVVCNEFLLEHFLAPDGEWGASTRTKVRLFEAILLGTGLALFLLRNHLDSKRETLHAKFLHWSKLALLRLAMLLFILATLEIATLFLIAARDAHLTASQDPEKIFSDTLGYVLRPDTTHTMLRELDGRTLFNVVIHTDGYSRRATEFPESVGTRDRALLFFGGSFMLGHGVADDRTLPFRAGTLAPDFQPYNFGAPGYGPQQMLVKLRAGDLGDIIDSEEPILVYGFIPDHARRVAGSMRKVAVFARHFPCFEIDDSGALVLRGSFAQARTLRTRLYSLLADEAIMKYLNIDLPITIRERDIELTARIVQASRDAFQKRFPNGHFYVMLWPVASFEQNSTRRFAERVREAEITVLDYSGLVDMDDPQYIFDRAYDRHPTAATHARVAERLVEDLELTPPSTQEKTAQP